MTAAYEESLSRAHELYNTIPNVASNPITVGATSATTPGTAASSALTPYAGRWIWLLAVGGPITVMRGQQTVTLGVGVNLPAGVLVPWLVSADLTRGDFRLSHISDGAGRSLYILSDSEAG